jgi:adenosine deaminase
MNIYEFAHRMPKAELHVHLEGSILPETLLLLAERNKIELPYKTLDGLKNFYQFRDFPHFVETYWTITGCLREPEDYYLVAYEFGRECARQNIRYAEVTFSISTNAEMTGYPWQMILNALNEGRIMARSVFGVSWQWVFDIVRNKPETQETLTDITLESRSMGVAALGLGGSEAEYPAHLFSTSFDRAHQAGMHSVPHAGETAGPISIWEAINLLHADRIGHGVRCIEDPELVKTLYERQIPLEICPTSNIALGVYHDYTQHPLRKLWDTGLMVTVNSDDPPMFNTCLNQEYQVLIDHFGFGFADLEKISLNAVYASFLSDTEKTALADEFKVEFTRLRNS